MRGPPPSWAAKIWPEMMSCYDLRWRTPQQGEHDIDVHIRYTLEPEEGATSVIRDLDLSIQIPGLLKVAEPSIRYVFRKENVRILAELKRYVEAQPT